MKKKNNTKEFTEFTEGTGSGLILILFIAFAGIMPYLLLFGMAFLTVYLIVKFCLDDDE